MKINKIFILSLIVLILSAIVLIILVDNNPPKEEADIYNYAAERILYLISKGVGRQVCGLV